jgi:hypothetical protein
VPTYRILVRTTTFENRWVTADTEHEARLAIFDGTADGAVETLESEAEEIIELQAFGDPTT